MNYTIRIVPSALAELKAIRVNDRRRIADAIESRLVYQPARPSRHMKQLRSLATSFAHVPPLWELRVGDFRVFYDVDESNHTVFVRAVRSKPPHQTTEVTV